MQVRASNVTGLDVTAIAPAELIPLTAFVQFVAVADNVA
jgi:hypothetical protein